MTAQSEENSPKEKPGFIDQKIEMLYQLREARKQVINGLTETGLSADYLLEIVHMTENRLAFDITRWEGRKYHPNDYYNDPKYLDGGPLWEEN